MKGDSISIHENVYLVRVPHGNKVWERTWGLDTNLEMEMEKENCSDNLY